MATGTAGSRARGSHYQFPHVIARDFTYADTGALTVGVVPANSTIQDVYVIVSTAFNAGSSNVLDIGTSGDDDGFATDLALGTIGKIAADEMATSNDLGPFASDTTIIATPALGGTAATAGVGRVVVTYIVKNW